MDDSERAAPAGAALRIPRARPAGALLLSAAAQNKKATRVAFCFCERGIPIIGWSLVFYSVSSIWILTLPSNMPPQELGEKVPRITLRNEMDASLLMLVKLVRQASRK